MITIERLHPSEFDLLRQVDDGFCPDPVSSIAVVARNASRIISRAFLLAPTHIEGIFVEPEYRGTPVFKRVMDAIEIEGRAERLSKIFAYAVDSEKEDYLLRLGYVRMPWHVMVKEL